MTRYGETDGYTASQHVAQIVRYGEIVPDAVLIHQGQIPAELVLKYKAEEAHQVRLDVDNLYNMGVKVIRSRDVMSATSLVRYDPARTAKALLELFGEFGPMKRPGVS